MSPAWPLLVPADSLHFATVLIVLAISVAPQAARPRSNPILRMRYVLLFRSCNERRPPLPVRLPCARDEDRCAGRVSGPDDRRPQTGNKPCSRSRSRSGSARDAGMPIGSERSDWKKRNQSRRAIGIVPDHSSRTCSDLAIPSVQIIAETGVTYTGLVSSFAGSGHTVLDSPTAQSLTPGDFLML